MDNKEILNLLIGEVSTHSLTNEHIFATKAHMFADNPLKRLTFWMIQNSIDTVNTVAN